MSYRATRRIQFCAGHRVLRHESKCANMHGHNYVALIEAAPVAGHLDDIGRVIDFSVIKRLMGGWIEAHWDHGFLAWEQDKEVLTALSYVNAQKYFLMPCNPTAENMAHYLLHEVAPKLFENTDAAITKVTIWETENCFAEARP